MKNNKYMKSKKECPQSFSSLIYYLVKRFPGINTHALNKIAYLTELKYLIEFGEKLTEVDIIRLERGPTYANYKNLFDRLEYFEIILTKNINNAVLFYPGPNEPKPIFETDIENSKFESFFNEIDQTIKNHSKEYWKILIEKAYNTKPLKRIVEYENNFNKGKKYLGRSLFKSPNFIKKNDCSSEKEENLKKRENERIKMRTKLSEEESKLLKNKLSELKSRLLSKINNEMPDIIENEDDKELMKNMAYAQRNALKSLS